MNRRDARAVLGCVDTLGVALARHGHVWSTLERAGYERAVRVLSPLGSDGPKDYKTLCGTVGAGQVLGRLTIPARAIVRVTALHGGRAK